MEYRFQSDEWRGLRRREQARRCRLLAEEAEDLASGAPPVFAERYRRIAAGWRQLAEDIDRAR